MKKKFNTKIFIIIVLTIVVFLYLIIFNIKKNTQVEVSAEISKIGTNYVIATDGNNIDYLLNTSEQYSIGDKIKVLLKNVKEGSPCTGEIIKLDIVSRNVSFSITDTPVNDDKEETTNETPNETGTNAPVTNETPNETITNETTTNENVVSTINTEEQVVAYFTNFSAEIDGSSNFKDTIKEKFITIVDFLFYEGTIGDKTFAELSNQAKLKVLEITLDIDQKLENKYPGYKETISATGNKIYTNIKTKVIEMYLELTANICEDNKELCETAKEGLGELKQSFSLTWDFIKQAAGTGLEKLKSWYEIWKEV